MNGDSRTWRVGLVGYGEVGRILAEDLCKAGVRVAAFDSKLAARDGADAPLREHAARCGVAFAAAHAELAAQSDFVVSAVTASQAVAAAGACAPGLAGGRWLLDLNSASPGAKQRAAELVERAGGRYVEGAVMTSVPPHRIAVPLLLGGPHAEAILPHLARLGFAAQVCSPRLGVASATKMCRSVIIKGMEAMFIESLVAARGYGVEESVLDSLAETFPGIDWNRQASYFFERVVQHGRRRAEEMAEAAATVREMGLDAWSATGTAQRQAWMAELAAAGTFAAEPGAPAQRTWRERADRILRRLAKGAGALASNGRAAA
jgi:3-hydroxyisobutyrate dehydrogenase-like beta-hydroxyacid dehydrogenase